jgi:hypothetical protein
LADGAEVIVVDGFGGFCGIVCLCCWFDDISFFTVSWKECCALQAVLYVLVVGRVCGSILAAMSQV